MQISKQNQINSCGIQSIDTDSLEGRSLVVKLQAETGDKIARDHVRRCVCGKITIVYAYTLTKVTKYCESCGLLKTTYTKTQNH